MTTCLCYLYRVTKFDGIANDGELVSLRGNNFKGHLIIVPLLAYNNKRLYLNRFNPVLLP